MTMDVLQRLRRKADGANDRYWVGVAVTGYGQHLT